MSAVWSSFKRTANSPKRFDKPWQLTDRIWKHCKNQAMRRVSKIMCSVWWPKKKIKLCSASRMTFRSWFYRTDPQSTGGQFGTLSGFLRKRFGSERAKKKPRNIFQTEKFPTIFEKRTPIYSLAAPLLGLAKSMYERNPRASAPAEHHC